MIQAKQAKEMLTDKVKRDAATKRILLKSFEGDVDANVKLAIKQHRNTFNVIVDPDMAKYINEISEKLVWAGYDIADIQDSDDDCPRDIPIGSKIIFIEF